MNITATRWSRVLAVTAIAAAGLMLGGCSLLSQVTNQTERDDDGAVTETNDDASAFSIKVGDCLNDADITTEVETLPVVPCSEPHDSEAISSIIMDDADFPGDDATATQADEGCTADFADFVGLPVEQSALSYSYYRPTQESWDGINDREILCLVYDPAGQVTGTLKGAAK